MPFLVVIFFFLYLWFASFETVTPEMKFRQNERKFRLEMEENFKAHGLKFAHLAEITGNSLSAQIYVSVVEEKAAEVHEAFKILNDRSRPLSQTDVAPKFRVFPTGNCKHAMKEIEQDLFIVSHTC